ncbi:MAG: Protein TolB [Anaerolineales bacterium]|nr:Protein TolB [Anaerolineales bacterium]
MKRILVLIMVILLTACSSKSTPTLPPLSETPILELTSTPIAMSSSTPAPVLTSTPIGGGSGKIAYSSKQNGEQHIYVIDVDGKKLLELAGNISSKFYPDWTLDGTKLSFISTTEGFAQLYIMDADGSNLVKVLDTSENSAYDQINPYYAFEIDCCISAWSPDGEKIIFRTSRQANRIGSVGYMHVLNLTNNQNFDFRVATWAGAFWSSDSTKFGVIRAEDRCGDFWLCVMNTGDGKPVDLKDIYNVTFPSYLYWSPDENKISFAAFWNNSKNMDVYVMDEDFSNAINITAALVKGQNENPVWSPDSQKIAFTSCDVYLCELYVANADGTNLIKLKPQILGLNSVVWSRDSEKIVYVSAEDGNSEIYIMNSDGNNPVNLTNHPANDGDPIWSPDGTKLAFVSDRDGDDDIYILDMATMELFNLTNNDVDDSSPVWLP